MLLNFVLETLNEYFMFFSEPFENIFYIIVASMLYWFLLQVTFYLFTSAIFDLFVLPYLSMSGKRIMGNNWVWDMTHWVRSRYELNEQADKFTWRYRWISFLLWPVFLYVLYFLM